jgi:4-amino-4-deoxy-L-arabinose transferase-like glycosyltransferase
LTPAVPDPILYSMGRTDSAVADAVPRFVSARSSRWQQRMAANGVPVWLVMSVVLLPLVLLFLDLGTPSLWDPDEGLPAEVAREMRISGDWLAPHLDSLLYPHKPPAYFWVLAAAMKLFGDRNEAALRLPSVLLALGGVWYLLVWGWRHLRPVASVFGALVLATSAGYVALGRLAIEDAAAGTLLAVATLAMSEPLLSRRSRFPWFFYAALAAATLCLGISVLLLPLLVAVTFTAVVREPGRLLDLRPLRGLGIWAAVVVPVFVLAAAHDPQYAFGLLHDHSLIRFLDVDFDDRHSYSLFALVALSALLMLPWGMFLPWVLRDAARSGGERSPDARVFLIVWLAADLAFFELTAANLAAYVVLILVPLAALAGRALSRFLRRPHAVSALGDPVLLATSVICVIVLIAPFLTRRILQNEFPTYADKIIFAFLLIPFAAAGLGAVVRRNRVGALSAVTACGVVTLVCLYHFGSATVSDYNSMEMPADLIGTRLPPNAALMSYGTTGHTLAFYSGRPVRMVERMVDAQSALNGDTPIALLTKERYLPEVRAQLKRALYVWWVGDSKKVLLANIPPPPQADRRILLPAPPGA